MTTNQKTKIYIYDERLSISKNIQSSSRNLPDVLGMSSTRKEYSSTAMVQQNTGSFTIPNGIHKNSYCPSGVTTTVLYKSSGATGICQRVRLTTLASYHICKYMRVSPDQVL